MTGAISNTTGRAPPAILRQQERSMLMIVAMGWLFVIGTMSLAAPSFLWGVTQFMVLGMGPVWLMFWLAWQRHRSRMARQLMAEQDRAHAEADHEHLP